MLEEVRGVSLPDLKRGDKNQAVKILQILLNGQGFNCGSVDGSYGPKTQTAVTLANKAHGSVASSVNIDTWKYLFNK